MDLNNPLTILFAINDLSFGGGQKTVVREANLLSERGYTVYVMTLLGTEQAGFSELLKLPSERVIKLGFKGFSDFGEFRKLARILKEIKPAVIFSNLFFTNAIIRMAKLFVPSIRICVREGNLPVEKSWKVRFIDRMLSFVTETVIVNAAALKNEFQKIGIAEGKIRVLYNGIDPEFFSIRRDETGMLRNALGIDPKTFLFSTVGSLTKKKGHEHLLRAFSALRVKNPDADISLLFAGGGPLQSSLESLAQNLGIRERVYFAEPRRDTTTFLEITDAAVSPSLWEGLPNALLESLAAGVPSIATAVGGVPEVITDGENGLLIPPADVSALENAMLKIWRDAEFRKKIAERARPSVEKYTWSRHADELVAIIHHNL